MPESMSFWQVLALLVLWDLLSRPGKWAADKSYEWARSKFVGWYTRKD